MSTNESEEPVPSTGSSTPIPTPIPKRRTRIPQIEVGAPTIDLPIIIKANKLLKKLTDQFSQQINDCVSSFDSIENFVEESDIYINHLIEIFKKEIDLSEGQFLESFIIRFRDNCIRILNELKDIIETVGPATNSFTTDLDDSYSPGLSEGHKSTSLVSNSSESDSYQSLDKSYEIIQNEMVTQNEESYPEISDNQETNISILEQDDPFNIEFYLGLYKTRLEDSIGYPSDDKVVKQIHLELRSEFIKKFESNEKGADIFAFGQEIDKCFNHFKVNLLEREANMQIFFKNAKSVYTHGMDDCFKNDKFYTTETLSELQKDWKARALEILNINFEQTFGEECDSYELSQELIKDIEKEFDKYKDKNDLRQFKSERLLDANLKVCSELYEKQLQSLIDIVDNQNQLLDKNESLRQEIIEYFKRESSSIDQDILETYLNRLEKCFERSFHGVESVLELRLHKERVKRQQIESYCREYYKQQMETKFELKKFYFQKTLISFNERFVKDLSQKFSILLDDVKTCTQDIFNDFVERNARNTPKEPAIGIDLGTTNSCVAYFMPDLKAVKSTVVIQNDLGKDITPSVVSFRANNEVVVGEAAKGEEDINPENTIHSVKRFIGQTFTDLRQNKINEKFLDNLEYKLIEVDNKLKINVKVEGVEKQYFPEEVSAKVLEKMKLIAQKYLGEFKVKKVVITVPAYFTESQKEATKQAGALAGFEVLGIINEPTAAAIAFKIDHKIDLNESTILVFDFGGGTLDVAIVRLERGNIIVNNVKGDNYLGGDDIDSNLIDYCLKEFQNKTGKAFTKKELPIHRLRRVCEESKRKISSVSSTKIFIKNFHQDHDLFVELTRKRFNEINKAIFKKCKHIVKEVIEDSTLNYTDINHILLVGGSTRIPKIQEMLSKLFNKRALNQTLNPEQSVAIGAAVHAATLNGQLTQEQIFKFTDVTSISLGVQNSKNEMLVLIPRNTKLPANITRIFETYEDNQDTVKITVYEGEHRLATNNHLLGEFDLEDLPCGKKGEIKIDVTFDMNEEGILTVSAKCDRIESKLVIKEHKCRLTEEQMEDLIKRSN